MTSIRQLHASGRRARLRPRLETLEDRWCPSSNTLLGDGTLLVLGDDDVDIIDIRDDGSRGVTVDSEDGGPQTFLGVHRIAVRSAGGDDLIQHLIASLSGSPVDFRCDMGIGRNQLHVWLPFLEDMPFPAGTEAAALDIVGGSESDLVTADLAIPPGEGLTFRADLGGGDDSLLVRFIPVEQVLSVPPGVVRLEGLGGAGLDRLNMIVGDPEGRTEPPVLNAHVVVKLNGGPGEDVQNVEVLNTTIAGTLSVNLQGGPGNDTESAAVRGVTVDGTLLATIDGQDGADHVGLDVAWQVNAGAHTEVNLLGGHGPDEVAGFTSNHVAAGARSIVHIDGGAGSDLLGFQYEDAVVAGEFRLGMTGGTGAGNDVANASIHGVTVDGTLLATLNGHDGADQLGLAILWQVNAGAYTEVNLLGGHGVDEVAGFTQNHIAAGGLSVVNIDGGADNDRLSFRYEDALVDGEFRIAAAGDMGDDRIDIRIDIRPESRGRIVAKLLGESGNDELSLSAIGVSHLENFGVLLDGGTGRDKAGVTRDVLSVGVFRSVEEIFLIE